MAIRAVSANEILQSCFVDCKTDKSKVKLIFFSSDWNRLTRKSSPLSPLAMLTGWTVGDPVRDFFERTFEVDESQVIVDTEQQIVTLTKTEELMKRILGLMPKKNDDPVKSDIINKNLLTEAPRILNPSEELLAREAAIVASRSPYADGAPE